MFKIRLTALMLAIFLAAPAVRSFAQLGAPNASGVSIGHVHLTVRGSGCPQQALGLARSRSDARRLAGAAQVPRHFCHPHQGEPRTDPRVPR